MAINNVSFEKVKLLDGFWKKRYDLNADVSIYAVQKRFEDSGRFDAVRFIKNNENIHVYYDSDVAKWIEAVAYLAGNNGKKYSSLVKFCDKLIDSIAKNQREDGYYNSYFQQKEPTEYFKRRNDHELYCAGHLIEAAIAYDKYVKNSKLLCVVEKYASLIKKCFMDEGSAGFVTCGHEEIELALFKLYDYTGNADYRALAEFFVDQRANNDKDQVINIREGMQDDKPAREITEAMGHAVRAMYFYSAMADYALINGDKEMEAACDRVFSNILKEKMYVTGGLGSIRFGEAFTLGYDLPNHTAYAESCAGIGFIMFLQRLNKLKIDGVYADTIERVMYNVFMSSTSLDGKSFFYENPLEICRKEKDKETSTVGSRRAILPIWRRKEVFDCSCCPPNINRFVASIAGVIYTQTEDGVYVNQYVSSKYDGITVKTDYPNKKTIKISGKDYGYEKLFVRIPAWCNNYKFVLDGVEIKPQVQKGYAELDVKDNFNLVLTLNFAPRFIESNPKVRDNAGRVCLMNGPIVYCLEEVDNGSDLYSISVNATGKKIKAEFSPEYNLNVYTVKGVKKVATDSSPLYAERFERKEVDVKFIPYFAFANREESDMLVWVNALT